MPNHHAGAARAEILRNYPGLTQKDTPACLAYANTTLQAERGLSLYYARG
ncbi:MAG: DUF433 domain-containing protein [Chloroflexi bacterium]|nr:DUF433 domain-containing protein [Chloroflexota bacterium]MBU1746314.1 DUF433 domain-containing protein [Chloroflexota bacterium]MBU1877744.1 DUF433 domain-containing protein [Chloroflexota bacterium]